MIVYRRGRWSPVAGSFQLPASGAFTTLTFRTGRPLFFGEHIERLQADARAARIRVPEASRTARTLRRGIARFGLARGVARLIVTRADGAGTGELTITLELPRPTPRRIRLLLVSHTPTCRRDRTLAAWNDARWALIRAQAAGCFDALLVDGTDVLECCRANVLVVRNDRIVTPPADGRILPGIARRFLMDAAALGVMEHRVGPGGLRGADALLLINSVRGVLPVADVIDERGQTLWCDAGRSTCADAVRQAWRRIVRQSSGPHR